MALARRRVDQVLGAVIAALGLACLLLISFPVGVIVIFIGLAGVES